ncbi:hypothetical protein M3Y98_00540400 [Aphelenchoides besseyi]|nr:hypothetical protein M3Y98_00540400 [Aphelenchoides besseyi]
MFKRGHAHESFPTSERYEGPVNETQRHRDIEHLPIHEHATVYLESGRSDDHKPTEHKPVTTEEVEIVTTDYPPIHEPFDYETDETRRRSEMDGHPIEHHVSIYSSGRSDEPKSKTPEPSVASKLTSLFKKSDKKTETGYPEFAQYEGPVNETQRHRDIEHLPIHEHATVYLESGRSDDHKPTEHKPVTTEEVEIVTTDYPPIHEPFDYETDETRRRSEMDGHPIEHHVSIYSSGRSDEPKSKTPEPSVASKLTSLFKKSDKKTETGYPEFAQYEGPVNETQRHRDIEHLPIHEHATVYLESGRSDDHKPTTEVQPTVVEEVIITTKPTVSTDYPPIHEPFDYETDETRRRSEMDGHPIEHHVSIYSSGRSDEPKQKSAESVTSKLSSLFKRGHAHESFPTSERYEGPVNETQRHRDIEHLPIHEHATVYLESGRSDDHKPTTEVQPTVVEEVIITTKPTVSTDYPPIHEPFDYETDETRRRSEMDGHPIEHHVSIYSSGKSDEPKSKTPEPSVASKLTSLFKKSDKKTETGYPEFAQYEGPVNETQRHRDIEHLPIHEHATVYLESGRSDDHKPTEHKPVTTEEVEIVTTDYPPIHEPFDYETDETRRRSEMDGHPIEHHVSIYSSGRSDEPKQKSAESVTSKLSSLFKRGHAHESFPTSERYEGPVNETQRHRDIEHLPIHEHATVYLESGRSDDHKPTEHKPVTTEEVEIVTTDYPPIHEPFDYETDETRRRSEMDGHPIEHHVSIYSSGRSDEPKSKTPEPSVASKLTSLFKKSDKKTETGYPEFAQYEGPVNETQRHRDIEHLPIHEHATVYLESGRSDDHKPTEHKPVTTEEVEIVTTDYPPIHEPFDYETDETRRRSEMDGHPIEHHVSIYSSGRSDEPKSKTPEPSVASKLTSLFKKSDKKTETGYPEFAQYEGPVNETQRHRDIEHLPIHEHATVYLESGRSDDHKPTTEVQPTVVEEVIITTKPTVSTDYPPIHEPFDYETDETRRRSEMDGHPIEHHVSIYSSGKSDEPKSKTPEPSVASKLTSLFKKSDKKTETGYPEFAQYEGPVNETQRHRDIEHLPIHEHATVYLESGRSDDHKPTTEVQPTVVEEVIITTKPTVSTDYPPIHEPFDYETDETRRRSEMDGHPIEHHVSIYSSGRSDEPKQKSAESVTSKLSSLFKRGHAHESFPTSERYEGPVNETQRHRDIEHLPIHEHATVYLESGRSDDHKPTEHKPVTTEEVEIVTTDYPPIHEPFDYETDETRRRSEMDGHPIEHHVSIYSSGRSDEPKSKTPEPSVASKLTSLFKKSDKKTETGYPEFAQYEGPVNETQRHRDIEHLPIHEHATVYLESGRSDDHKPTEHKPVTTEEVEIVTTDYPPIHEPFDYETDETRRRSEMDGHPIEHHVSIYSSGRSDEPKSKTPEPSVASKLTSLFKKSDKKTETGYPEFAQYEGPVNETQRHRDIEHLPIHEHATVYLESGRSDDHKPTTEVQPTVVEEVIITTKPTVSTDYPPIHEPFDYETDETRRRSEMDGHPIEHHVSIYSSGRSDEPKQKSAESVTSKLSSLFKRGHAHESFPTSERYEGPVNETQRHRDIEHLPIHEHATVYLESGRSDDHKPTTEVQPTVVEEVIITTKPTVSTDYPPIHEPFDYETDETRRRSEMDGHPIEHHVSIYSSGRSDEPKQKSAESVTSKLSSLFKRGHAHESFPTSERYEGPVNETQRHRDIEHLPIHEHATVYLESGRSDDHKPTEHKPVTTEEVEIVTTDYPPIHEPFDYETDETRRRSEMDGHPIEHHVSIYSSGRSDEPKSKTPEPSVASKLTSLFKKSDKKTETGYPEFAQYEGPVNETQRHRDIEHLPIHEHATVYLESGRSDDHKPTEHKPVTTEEVEIVTTDYPPIHEPFDYETDETRRRSEMDGHPIEHHVSIYSSGRSDEPKSKTPEPSVASKLTSLFKKSDKKTETGYPEFAQYEGPVNETQRHRDIEHLPIHEHATVYLESGRSDDHKPTTEVQPTVVEEVIITTKPTVSTDYPPIHEPFDYETDETRRRSEMDGHPIEHHVSIYSSGRSDEPKQKSAESVTSKLSSLFKRGHAHESFPTSERYEGPVNETQRHRDIEHLPIHEHATVYLESGRSDDHKPTTEVQPTVVEEVIITTKPTVSTDYPPIHEPFDYETDETRRRSEMDGHPIEHHVSIYSSGKSDEPKSKTPEPSVASKLTSLFKKSDKKTETGYPEFAQYEGPVNETQRHRDIEHLPIHEHATVYLESGRSDDHKPTEHKPVTTEEVEIVTTDYPPIHEPFDYETDETRRRSEMDGHPIEHHVSIYSSGRSDEPKQKSAESVTSKLSSLFKRGHAHESFPTSERYEGPVNETQRHRDIEHLPIHEHATVYLESGRSDDHKPTEHKPVTTEEVEIVTTDYPPIHEPFDYETDETRRRSEMDGHPIEHHVSIYSSGRSDEPKSKTPEPSVASKLTSLFKKSDKKTETGYPEFAQYEGPVNETQRHRDIEHLPIHEHATVYLESGRSDDHKPTEHKPVTTEEVEIVTTDYPPIHEPFDYETDETRRRSEMDGHPIEHHVSIYSSGRSDEPKSKTPEPSVASKLTSLFKKSDKKTETGYPEFAQYEGPVNETQRHRDIEHLPIHEHATVYLESGRSDDHKPTTEVQPTVVEEVIITTKPTVSTDYPPIHEPFDYETDETRRRSEMDGHPIEHHVSIYSSGRSDEPKQKSAESVTSKLSSLFKRGHAHESFPTSERYEGPVNETQRHRDIEHLPIHEHATVYLESGRSDDHKPTTEVQPTVVEEVIITTKPTVSTDYPPIHEPFDYETDETRRRSEMDGHPIEHHVSIYSSGRSDEPKQKSAESVTSKLSSLFKRGHAHESFPTSERYEGPVNETQRHRDIEHLPIHEHATVYLESGRSDDHKPTEHKPVTTEEVEIVTTDYPPIHEPFDYETDETRRRSEMDGHPIEHHVSIYSSGRSDEPKSKTPEPSVASKLTSLFKKSDKKTETGYPEFAQYEGPVNETQRHRDIEHLPIHEHATVYLESGRSDDHKPTEHKPVTTEEVEIVTTDYPPIHEPFDYETDETRRRSEMDGHPIEHHVSIYSSGRSDEPKSKTPEPSVASKLTSLFKKSDKKTETGYPEFAQYEGPVNETQRHRDIEHLPIHEHATVYLESGRSDDHKPTTEVQPTVVEEVIITTKPTVSTDYPPIHEPFDYETDETRRRSEMDGHPIEHHVSIYSSGRSDEPKSKTPEPSVASKLTSLFKKSDKKTETGYPEFAQYEGPVNETQRHRDIEHLPIHEHATVYLESGRSDDHKPTTEVQPTVVEEVIITTKPTVSTDYPPIHEPFDYETDETRRRSEMDGHPIEHHVSIYSSGKSDEPKSKTPEPSVASKLTSLFKKSDKKTETGYPEFAQYEGPVNETQRHRDIEHLPIHEHATVYLESGRSDDHKPTEHKPVTTEEVEIVTTDYPPIHEPFDYETDETRRRSEMDGHPIEHHVSIYSSGRSDEPKQKRHRDIEHLPIHEHATVYLESGRSDDHKPTEHKPVTTEEVEIVTTDYPPIHEPFDYETDETRRRSEMDGHPIEHHVSIYSSGRSDEPKSKTPEPSVASKLTSLFKKSDKKTETGYPEFAQYEGPVNETQRHRDIEHLPIHEHATVYLESGRSDDHKPTTEVQPTVVEEVIITTKPTVSTDYPPIHEPFDYETDETRRRSEMDGHPIEHHVSIYSSGRSDEPKQKSAESVTSKLSSLFKQGHAHESFPTSERYEGPVNETQRHRDIEHLPIHEHATVYLESGRSDDHKPTEHKPVTTEEVEIVTTDYPPIHEPFDYETDETRRRSEMDGHPIEHHVSIYSSGRSDEPKSKTPEPSVASKLTSLFKKSDKKTETGYPEFAQYEGPVNETQRHRDIEHLPIHEHATVYLESGRSDDHKPTTEVQPTVVEEVIITTKPTVSTDYPPIHEPFDYETDETRRRSEMDGHPIEHHVSIYSSGRSDEPKQKRHRDIEHLPIHEHATVYLESGRSDDHKPTEHKPVTTEEVEIVTTDYPPIHEPFDYETDETRRRSEMDGHPIEHHVSIYSSGRSDEPKSKTPEPSVASKLTSLFKKSDKKTETGYPEFAQYEGPVNETQRHRDIEHLPIHEHATVYLESGRSDDHKPTTEVQPTVVEEVIITTKPTVSTDYPPIHEPFDYETDETRRRSEMDGHPIEHHVSIYSSGKSDEPKSKTPEPSVASKLTSLFKKSDKKTETGYPEFAQYEGPVNETQRHRDIEHLPIHEHATVYLESGRSDDHKPTEHKPVTTEEVEIVTTDYPPIHEPFDYETDETRRRSEMDGHPIEHHVSIYSSGRSDEPKSKTPEPSVASKLTSLFKKSDKKTETGYPEFAQYEGPVNETQRHRDIEHLPIHEHATVYLESGRSDDHKPTTEVQPTVVEEVIITTKPTVSTDYPPIHEPFDYETDETRRRSEMDGHPIEHHVSIYSSGKSDEPKSKTPEPSVASKLTSLFKKSDKKTETGYPEFAQYEGPVNETQRHRDIEHLPIHEHATVYLESGRSDDHKPTEHKPVTTEEVEIVTTDYPPIHEPFDYETDETRRRSEMDGHPIEHHVSIYSSGRSDEPKSKTPEPSVASKLTSLFKKSDKKTETGYPEFAQYEGPVNETQRHRDIEHLPIHEHATVYLESGRSDDHKPTEHKPVTTEEVEIVTTDYPPIHEPFDYETDETRRRSEMDGHPIEHHVSIYSSGKSDEPKSKTPEPSVASKLTSLFKKSDKKTETGYPEFAQYEGPVNETQRHRDIEHLPIHEHATVYLESGRSDDHKPTEHKPVTTEEVEIVTTDYPPIHEPFDYETDETRRRSEMDGHPIEHHVSIYSSGRSDEPKQKRHRDIEHLPIHEHATVYLESGRSDDHKPTEHKPVTTEEVEIVTTDYPPIHEPFDYETDETRRRSEMDGHPIEHHVSIYSSGRSDEPKSKTPEPSVASKLTSLFKKSDKKTETGYPEFAQYEGPVNETQRHRDIEHLPIHEHATVYLESGRSDDHKPTTEVQPTVVEEVIITTKPTVSTDYPPIHEPFDYETDETRRRSEMDGHPIEHHVSIYSSGRSDEPKQKRHRDIEHLPIHEHATVYLESGRSDDHKPTEHKPVTTEEVEIVTTDYPPIHEPFDYETDETRRRSEMDGHPIEHHVSIYSSGRSDEPKSKTPEPSVASKLTSLFKKSDKKTETGYPEFAQYEGPVNETQRHRDIEHLPIHEHATVYLESGRSDDHKPTEHKPVTTEEVEIVTTDYPPIHEPFDYETDETRRRSEMDGHPIEHHVSIYSSGRSDEPKSKTPEPSVASKLTSLFKKSDKKTETGYPEFAQYEGPVNETQRHRDIEHLPIHEHATVYLESGRSDDHKPTTEVQPTVVEEVIITTKPTVSTDYPPIHEPFDYETDETRRRSEMDGHPIEHHVSIYSSGRSDEPKQKSAESVTSKLSSLFKQGHAHESFPTSERYEGPVNETQRHRDIEHLPIHEHATVYLESGRSDDHKPTEHKPVTTEEVEIVTTDYPPIHEPFDYETDETRRRSEMDGHPIEHHVSIYSSGRSDEPKSKTPEPSVASKLTSLFKKSDKKTETGYPEFAQYEGPVNETQRHRDIEHLPIHEHATVYLESGRSDDHKPTEHKPVTTEEVEIVTTDYPPIHEPFDYETDETRRRSEMDGHPIEHHVSIYSSGRSDEPKSKTPEPSVASKLTSLFKKSDKKTETGYPEFAQYEGPVNETQRHRDIEHLPIHEHATVYLESGRSDDHKPTTEVQPTVVEEVIITTKPTVSTDYPPIHEPFDYETDETRRRSEMDGHPIEHHVSIYSSGRSDEPKQKSAESVTSKLSSLFKRGHAHESFPTSERYEGPVNETQRHRDIEHLPIHEHATVYLESGRSDDHKPTEHKPVTTEEVEIVTTDYPPIHEPFDYETDETRRRSEMDGHPIEHHVSIYSSGRSGEPKSKTPEPSVASKLTSLFKKSDKKTETGYPEFAQYEGPVNETQRHRDIEHLPIHEHATVYLESGRSDDHKPTEHKPVTTEEVEIVTTDYPPIHEPFDYETDETRRRSEMDGHPIEHHVSIYSSGRSDEPKSKTPEPSVASKLTSLFKKSDKKTETGYPEFAQYEGPVNETQRHRDIEHLPIHEHATVYLESGRSDDHKPTEHKPVTTEEVEIVTTDYPPIHEPFDYETDETRRRSEMDGHPIEHHVSIYSSGRSDEPKSKTPEPSVASKLTSLFKKSDKKTETGYPEFAQYEGPVNETQRHRDIEHLPIHEHATVYLESGRSDDHKPTEHKPVTTEEVEIVTTDYPPIHEPFDYETDETRRRSEMDGHPIEHHVSIYSSGRSDEPKQKSAESVTSKLSSLFKRGHAHESFPTSERYEGPVNETQRHRDIEHLPIHEHATVYLESGRSDDHKPTEHKPVTTEEVEIVTTDYPPIHEPFDYETDETRRRSEMDGHPIEHHVSIYSSGRSDEPKSKTPEPSVASKLTSLFKKSDKKTETGYPEFAQYEGPVNETQRHRDIEHLPIHEHATVYLESGRSDDHKPTTEVQPTVVEEVIITTKPTVSTDYPPIHEPFDYETDETRRRSEMDGHPIEHHVSIYSSGRSDEPKQKSAESVTSKLSSLFKRGHAHESFPTSERYEGPVNETQRHRDIEHLPIHEHATVYLESGRSDDHKPTTEVQPTVVEEVIITTKPTVSTDYPPIHEPFDYETDETRRRSEMDGHPIEHHVSIYSSGRSDEPKQKRHRDIEHLPIHEHATVYLESGRSDDHKPTEHKPVTTEEVEIVTTDYPPIHEPFDYETDETRRRSEMDGHPIEHHVSIYSSGRSDEPKQKSAESVTSKLSSLFKRGHAHESFPTSERYEGPVNETQRHRDIEHLPIHEHATVYLESGRSDDYKPGMQKIAVAEERTIFTDYPAIQKATNDVTDETRRSHELGAYPIEHHVARYSFGRSDDTKVKSPVFIPAAKNYEDDKLQYVDIRPRSPEAERLVTLPDISTTHVTHTSVVEKPVVHSTDRSWEFSTLPISQYCTVYNKGRSDLLTSKSTEEKSDTFSKITTFFRRGHAHEDKPTSQRYTGKLSTLPLHHDLPEFPVTKYVHIYHDSGRSDVELSPYRRQYSKPRTDELPGYPNYRYVGHLLSISPSVEFTPRPIEKHVKLNRKPPPYSPSAERTTFDVKLYTRSPSPVRLNIPPKSQSEHEMREVDERWMKSSISTSRDDEWRRRDVNSFIDYRSEHKPRVLHERPPLPVGPKRGPNVTTFHAFANERDMVATSTPDYSRTYERRSRPSDSSTVYLESSERIFAHGKDESRQKTYDRSYARTPRSLSESRRLHGWTTVTERTTLTYSRHTSMQRFEGRRRQLFTESVSVHTYDHLRSPRRAFSPPLHTELDQRYRSYNRSRSQGPNESWSQTTFDASPRKFESSENQERTYRSYCSHLYDRSAIMRGYYPDEGIGDFRSGQFFNDSNHTTSSSRVHEIPVARLIDDLPSFDDDIDVELYRKPVTRTYPLESRLLEPGHHIAPDKSIPLNRTRRRVRNYCVMLNRFHLRQSKKLKMTQGTPSDPRIADIEAKRAQLEHLRQRLQEAQAARQQAEDQAKELRTQLNAMRSQLNNNNQPPPPQQ